MPKYCFDMSGLSNPHEVMPEHIHVSMWASVHRFLEGGNVAITREIFDEMVRIGGNLGPFIKSLEKTLVYEVNVGDWDYRTYLAHAARMQVAHRAFIRELNGGGPKTICLNDVSIICLAKTLALPVVSMESKVGMDSPNKRRIPDICIAEAVPHLSFNEFLTAEGFSF